MPDFWKPIRTTSTSTTLSTFLSQLIKELFNYHRIWILSQSRVAIHGRRVISAMRHWSCKLLVLVAEDRRQRRQDKIKRVISFGGPTMSKSWSNLSVPSRDRLTEMKQKHTRWRNNEWTEWPSTPEDATGGIKEIRVIKIESNMWRSLWNADDHPLFSSALEARGSDRDWFLCSFRRVSDRTRANYRNRYLLGDVPPSLSVWELEFSARRF